MAKIVGIYIYLLVSVFWWNFFLVHNNAPLFPKSNTPFTWRKKYLDRDLDPNLDCYLIVIKNMYLFTWDIHV